MSWPIMTCSQFDVVVVPFPFTDIEKSKRRPALVLSDGPAFNGVIDRSVMAMITTASHSPWPLDVPIQGLELAGLKKASIVRMKLFTIDNQLIQETVGSLCDRDQTNVRKALAKLLQFHENLLVEESDDELTSQENAGGSEQE